MNSSPPAPGVRPRSVALWARLGSTVILAVAFVWAVAIAGPRIHLGRPGLVKAAPAGERGGIAGQSQLELPAGPGDALRFVFPPVGSSAPAEAGVVPGRPARHLPPRLERPGGQMLVCYRTGDASIYLYENPGGVTDNTLFYRARLAFDGWAPAPPPPGQPAVAVFARDGRYCLVHLAGPSPDKPRTVATLVFEGS